MKSSRPKHAISVRDRHVTQHHLSTVRLSTSHSISRYPCEGRPCPLGSDNGTSRAARRVGQPHARTPPAWAPLWPTAGGHLAARVRLGSAGKEVRGLGPQDWVHFCAGRCECGGLCVHGWWPESVLAWAEAWACGSVWLAGGCVGVFLACGTTCLSGLLLVLHARASSYAPQRCRQTRARRTACSDSSHNSQRPF